MIRAVRQTSSFCGSRVLRLELSVVLLAALASFLGQANAGPLVLYETGFEAPDYVAGLGLVGQQAWLSLTGDSVPVVVADNPSSGSQAVRIQAGDYGPDGPFGVYRRPPDAFDAVAAGLPVVRVGVDARLDGPQTGPPIDGDFISANLSVIVKDPLGDCGFLWLLSSDGHAYASACGVGIYLIGTPVALGAYHRLEIELDFSTRESVFILDGVERGAFPFIPELTGNVYHRSSLQVVGFPAFPGFDPADYTAYFDNFSAVASVPEPHGVALLLIALSAMAAMRRRPRRGASGVPR